MIIAPVKSALRWIVGEGQTFARWVWSRVIPWLIIIGLAAAMLFDPSRDRLGVPGAAFAVAAVLASISFTYARALSSGTAIREELIFAGEGFAGGAINFLFATIFSFASHDTPRLYISLNHQLDITEEASHFGEMLLIMKLFGLLFLLMAFISFLLGLIHTERSVLIVSYIVRMRMRRMPNHKQFMTSPKSVRERIARMCAMDLEKETLDATDDNKSKTSDTD